MADPLYRSTTTSQTDVSNLKADGSEHATPGIDAPPAAGDASSAVDVEKQLSTTLSKTFSRTVSRTQSQGAAAPRQTGLAWFFVSCAMYTSAFLYGLDVTIVADIQAPVVERFGAVEKLAWLGVGFPLGSIAVIMSLGKAFGIFDVKWLYVASQVVFAVGSALCGAAPSMDALIVGRVIAGAGGAGTYLGVLNFIGVYTGDKERALYNALLGLVWGVGCILGPVIGGSFADSSATWRWAFYINLVLFGVASPVYFFLLDSYQPQPDTRLVDKLTHVDWLGAVLNAALYSAFVIVFTFAGAQWAWSDGRTIAMFVVLGVVLVAFALQQYYTVGTTAAARIFPVDFLARRSLVLLYVLTACAATGLFVSIYYIPLYFAFARGDSGVESAVRLLPFVCVNIVVTMLNGGLMPVFHLYYPWYLASGAFLLAGGAATYAVLDPDTPTATIYGLSVLIAIGAGLTQQAAYSIAPAKVAGPARLADAVGFINSAQIGAIVVALTISGAVFQNVGYRHVADALADGASGGRAFSSEEIRAALAGAKSAVFESATPAVRRAALEGIVKAIADAYILVVAAGALALVCAAFLRRERLFVDKASGGA